MRINNYAQAKFRSDDVSAANWPMSSLVVPFSHLFTILGLSSLTERSSPRSESLSIGNSVVVLVAQSRRHTIVSREIQSVQWDRWTFLLNFIFKLVFIVFFSIFIVIHILHWLTFLVLRQAIVEFSLLLLLEKDKKVLKV